MNAGNKKMLVLNSITYAYKARDFLEKRGIRCYIERIPKALRIKGCGYGVRVNNDAEIIAEMLNAASIHVKEIININ